jgi:hypothetical protein
MKHYGLLDIIFNTNKVITAEKLSRAAKANWKAGVYKHKTNAYVTTITGTHTVLVNGCGKSYTFQLPNEYKPYVSN